MAKKLIELREISKCFNDNKVLDNFSLYINENEFITLLGPSGCGKTTLLRIIGGFEEPDTGDVVLDGVKINDVPAHLRPVNTVFQRYALFPHLNVFDNVAFGLRNFNRTISDLKTKVSLRYENKRKELESKLKNKSITKEEKIEIKLELKKIKAAIKSEVLEEKSKLIEEKLSEVEAKYERIINKLDEQIDIEWDKDDEVKAAKNRLKEIDLLVEEAVNNGSKEEKEYKKYEQEIKKLRNVADWTKLTTLEKEKKEALKNKALEIKSAKSLMKNKKQIKEEVLKALKLVKLDGFENRRIEQMSGGQQQRVAIARAIVNKPRILLLDEPLAALDLKLRQAMQYELKEMQKTLGITFIFVTHDQEEALTMSDTIVVMNNGKIQQIGKPEDIYNEPKNRFVANFIGESNIIRGKYLGDLNVSFLDQTFKCVDKNFKANETVDVVIRPEDFDIVDLEDAKLIGVVEKVIFKGIHFEITAKVEDVTFIIRKYELFKVGDKIGLNVDPYEIHLMRVNEEL